MPDSLRFEVQANWGERPESPDMLANRLANFLARIAPLDPRLAFWYWRRMDHSEQMLDVNALPAIIAQGLAYDDDGVPEPLDGYHIDLGNDLDKDFGSNTILLYMTGSSILSNQIYISTLYNIPPSPHLVSYPVLRGALIAMSDTFEPEYAYVEQSDVKMMKNYKCEPGYIFPIIPICWMVDLPPALAASVTAIPSNLIVERRANGHLFLAATDEDFDYRDPGHIALAWSLYSVVHPLNKLPRGRT